MDDYRILSSGGCTTLDGVDDAEQFRGVKAAFDTIGLDEGSQMEVGSLTEISEMGLVVSGVVVLRYHGLVN